MSDAKRKTPRYPYSQAVAVRAPGSHQFLALRARDISEGGLFVVCEEAPELLTTLELRVRSTRGEAVTDRKSTRLNSSHRL